MALILKDRISETTTTTGTGTLTLGGALSGFQPFSSIGNTNTTYYCITDTTAWEVGLGTYSSSGNTLARTTVLSNSNNNTSPITLAAGTKTVFSVYPAERAVVVDGTTIQIPNNAVLPLANGGTGSSTAAFSGSNITDLNATAITAGTISNARTTASSSNGASTIVERDATGNFSTNVITANSYSGSGANLTSLNASSVSSGTLGVANGGTGAATLDANNVILGNGTSAVQFVAPGTNGNVLTSNGTTWTSAAAGGGGGSFVYLASATASASVVDFTSLDTSTYFAFLITFTDVRAGGMAARLYLNGTLNTSAIYNYAITNNDGSSLAPISNSNQGFSYLVTTNATTSNLGCSGYLYLFSAGGYSNFCGQLTSIYSTINLVNSVFSTFLTSATAANGIRFGGINMGNLTGGNFRLYGIKAS
jgi:hypothetical protein